MILFMILALGLILLHNIDLSQRSIHKSFLDDRTGGTWINQYYVGEKGLALATIGRDYSYVESCNAGQDKAWCGVARFA
jgi:hypothetical protein